jgi:Ion channel
MQNHPKRTETAFSPLLGFWTEERSLSLMLLLMILHLFVLTPERFFGQILNIIGALLLTLALLAGILTLVRRQALRRLGIFLVAGSVVFRILATRQQTPGLVIGDALFTLLSLSALLIIVYQQVSREGPVSAHRIRGSIALYLLIAMFFAFLYSLAEAFAPGAFNIPAAWAGSGASRGEAFYYFSMVTLTTVGFGDITPVHHAVRSLVMIEALVGQLYPAIMIARLVTLELETRRSGK